MGRIRPHYRRSRDQLNRFRRNGPKFRNDFTAVLPGQRWRACHREGNCAHNDGMAWGEFER
jgi:hypothetical protein